MRTSFRRDFTVSRYPTNEITFCYLENLWIFLQAAGNLLVELKAPFLNSFVIGPHGRISLPCLTKLFVHCQRKINAHSANHQANTQVVATKPAGVSV